MLNKSFKTCDEIPVIDARAIVKQVACVTAAVSDIEINRFDAAWITRFAAMFEGALEDAVTHTSCVCQGFKLWTYAANVMTDVVGGG